MSVTVHYNETVSCRPLLPGVVECDLKLWSHVQVRKFRILQEEQRRGIRRAKKTEGKKKEGKKDWKKTDGKEASPPTILEQGLENVDALGDECNKGIDAVKEGVEHLNPMKWAATRTAEVDADVLLADEAAEIQPAGDGPIVVLGGSSKAGYASANDIAANASPNLPMTRSCVGS
eukprot:scaffold1204_cov407-Prasinococcus_capsulatus_cf.AAC.8